MQRPLLTPLVLLCVAVAAIAASSSPALALSQRGHIFGFSFGSASAGELSNIAVDEATHEVYVVNRTANTVEQFKLNGEGKYVLHNTITSVSAPGYVAVDNSKDPSDPSAGDVYVSTRAPNGADIYKFDPSGTQVAKIAKVESEGEAKSFGRILGLAVTASGTLWVYQDLEGEAQVLRLTDAKANALIPPAFEISGIVQNAAPGFAVKASEDIFYIGQSRESPEEAKENGAKGLCMLSPCTIAEVGILDEGEVTSAGEPLAPELLGQDTSAVAVDLLGEGSSHEGSDDLYLDTVNGITVLNTSDALVQRFGSAESKEAHFGGLQGSGAVAIDSSTGDVFAVDAKAGTVDVFTPRPATFAPEVDGASAANVTAESVELRASIDSVGSETEYTFQYSTSSPVSCPPAPVTPCAAPVPPGELAAGAFGDQATSVKLSGLQPNQEYHYLVIAKNKYGGAESKELTFTTLAPAPSASVLPDGREWEMVSPPNKFGAGIEPMGGTSSGPIQAAAAGEGLAYAADSPIEASPEGNRNLETTQVLATRSSSGWSSKDIVTRTETSHGPSGFVTEYSLFSTDLSLALVYPFPGGLSTQAEPALSPNLSGHEKQEMTPYLRADGPSPPLTPEASIKNIYEAAAQNGKAMGNPGYVALVNEVNDTTRKPFGKQLQVENGTPDLSHVVLQSNAPLTTSQEAPTGLYEWSEGTLPAGQLQLISQLGDGTPAADAALGGPAGLASRQAISDEGTRVFWSGHNAVTPALFMRDTAKSQTVELSAIQEKETEEELKEDPPPHLGEGTPDPVYQIASKDGSKVLFTDTQRLSKTAGAAEHTDLYECEITEVLIGGHEEDVCGLTDLTPPHEGHNADVLGVVLGASESLSRAYFVANGVLSTNRNAAGEQAEPGNCVVLAASPPLPNAACNLYMSEADPAEPTKRTTTFIARLSNEDAPDWEAVAENLDEVTSRVSPSGEYLAFMSKRSLTGYDNSDLNSGQADEEVYRYDAANGGSLICASCNPTGARPTGVLDTVESGEGVGLLVDRRRTWLHTGVDPWLAGSVPGWTPDKFGGSAYQSRYLSDSGRLFFNSADALVPQDKNAKDGHGTEDVYEYEQPGVGGCTTAAATFSPRQDGCVALISSGTSSRESAFLDASESGADVFFMTAGSLVPQDFDTAYDVYDAHECTGSSPCVAPPPAKTSNTCETEASEASCRSNPPSASTLGTTPSTAFSGAGNVVPAQQSLPFKSTVKPLTRAQLLVKALKACKKKKSRSARLKCVRQAKKRYGPKSAKKAASKHESAAKESSR